LPTFVTKHRLAQLLRTDIRRNKVTSRRPVALLNVGNRYLPLYEQPQGAKDKK